MMWRSTRNLICLSSNVARCKNSIIDSSTDFSVSPAARAKLGSMSDVHSGPADVETLGARSVAARSMS
jgi:hypothetical protein